MSTTNLAVDASTDLKSHALTLRREWERVFAGAPGGLASTGDEPPRVRPAVAESWRRMAASGLNPHDLSPERRLTPEALAAARAASPLHRALPVLRRCLGSIAEDAEHILVVSDADGYLLWTEGHGSVLDASEEIQFRPGMLWTEESVGTNAIGTALATEAAVQIFSAEHFLSEQHPWWCSAAPVHSPHNGELLGVIDLSGPQRTAHPHSLALVQVAAALVERELAALPAPQVAGAYLEVMTRHQPQVHLTSGPPVQLSLRHAEALTLLALYPGGLSGDELTLLLYGDQGKRVSTRALMSRIRALTGSLVSNLPYRLAPDVRSDLAGIEGALRRGDVDEAIRLYHHPLLADSEVPAIEVKRREIDQAIRRACRSGGVEQLWRWVQRPAARHDLDSVECFIAAAHPGDPRVAAAQARRDTILEEWGG
ncbi:GAF domain-containing protein [Euzebya tangerina]|uniref:GAF domain-containing protein n=1 Tax=Euzebya tangerina TaxID=591198 RepID=UPI000E316AE6|nr:GAF domain-containing protein [Euzebya tangerina]